MITRLQVRNFKRFADVDIELGQSVVLIGPNNSGKSSALQALTLWAEGLMKWREKRENAISPEKRPGVTINRKDLVSIPAPSARELWRGLHVHNSLMVEGKNQTSKVYIDIIVEGVSFGTPWKCGLEFYYANSESIYCRPLRKTGDKDFERHPVDDNAYSVNVAYLPPMSGLAANETHLPTGKVNVLIGEGQTAQVLRNLCYQSYSEKNNKNWNNLVENIRNLFGVILLPPETIVARGEISMSYKNENNTKLDLSSSGRGLQQTLLILAFLYANPGSVLLLDEPDAHLEVLRQRQIYNLVTQAAQQSGSQIIAASHSEILLEEAAERDTVIAFLGRPHRIDSRGSQLRKALVRIGYDQYYQAEQKGWVLYLEGSTDLAILQAFAKTLGHEAEKILEQPFVHYTGKESQNARDHFFGLLEAKKDLVGIAVFDRGVSVQDHAALHETTWKRRELENYLCQENVLLEYARKGELSLDSANRDENELTLGFEDRAKTMKNCIDELTQALLTMDKPSPWSPDIKATDEFLDPLFKNFFEKSGVENLMRKTNYHRLAALVPASDIDNEICEKLDLIVTVAKQARPEQE